MGYNQNHAGINRIPNGYNYSTDIVDPIDRYGRIMGENIAKQRKNNADEVVKAMCKDISACNFVELWDKKGQEAHCKCGGSLKYEDKLELRFHKGTGVHAFYIEGKMCMDCGCKYVVKSTILKTLRISLS